MTEHDIHINQIASNFNLEPKENDKINLLWNYQRLYDLITSTKKMPKTNRNRCINMLCIDILDFVFRCTDLK